MAYGSSNRLSREIRAVRRSAFRTLFCVVFLVSGIAPAFCMWWDFRGDVSWQQQVGTFWTVALRTYPLTLSIAVIAMSRQLGWFRYGRFVFMGAVITAGACLGDFVSTISGSGDQSVQAANFIATPDNPVFGPVVNSFNYLIGYYQLYGARHFFAAILVGSFVGRTASKIVRRILELDSNDVGEIVETVRRRAA